MCGAGAQEGAYLLVAEMVKALEDPSRRRGAADAVVLFCTAPKYDIQEHLTPILTVRPHPIAKLARPCCPCINGCACCHHM